MSKVVLWPDKLLELLSYNSADMILGCLVSVSPKKKFKIVIPGWGKKGIKIFHLKKQKQPKISSLSGKGKSSHTQMLKKKKKKKKKKKNLNW